MEFIVVIGILLLVGSLFSDNGKDKSNCCPECGKPTLEVKRTAFLGKEYFKCSRWFCSWDSRTNHYRERKQLERERRAGEASLRRQVEEDERQNRIYAFMTRDD